MAKKPNVPMNHAITTCRHKVDKKKFDDGWERIWGKKDQLELQILDNKKAAGQRLRELEDEAIIKAMMGDDS